MNLLQSARQRGRRGLLGRLAVALTALAAAGQVSSFVHLGFVRHAVCAAHGESLHDAGAPRASEREPRPISQVGGAALALADAHGHCAIVAHRRDHTLLISESAPPRALRTGDAGVPLAATAPAQAAIAPLRLAPKSSPPL